MSASEGAVAVAEDGQKGRCSSKGYYCCVPLCKNRSVCDASLSFHCFPNEGSRKEARKAWLVAIRRDEGPHFKITEL